MDMHLATKKNGIHGSSFTGALHIQCSEVHHLLKMRFRSCMALFLPSRSDPVLLFCAKACENTIEV